MKISYEAIEALADRARTIGLHEHLAHECIDHEQQDIMLGLQKQVGFEKLVYLDVAKSAPQKPTRDYEAAQQKLDDLMEYARSLGDKDAWMLLNQVEILKAESHANTFRNRFKSRVADMLDSTKASNTRKDILTKTIMQYFDAYEPTKADYDIINDFNL